MREGEQALLLPTKFTIKFNFLIGPSTTQEIIFNLF